MPAPTPAHLREGPSRPSSRTSLRRATLDAPAGAGSVATPLLLPPHPPIQASALHLIQREIISVTSALRKSAKGRATTGYFGSSSTPASNSWDGLLQNNGTSAIGLTSYAAEAAERSLAADYKRDSNLIERHQRRMSSLGVSLTKRQLPGGVKGKAAAEGHKATATTEAASRNAGEALAGLERFAREDSESGLLASFAILKAQLNEIRDLHELPLPFLVAPFVKVILSPQTSGAITSAALQAVDRFLAYGLIPVSSDPEHIAPGTQMAISEIAHATSHCRFEASDPIVDELVLLRILNVMRELVSGQSLLLQGDGTTSLSLADALGNESICEMMETALSMCCQNRLSEVLRRSATQAMITMIRSLFAKLARIPLSADESYSDDTEPLHETLVSEVEEAEPEMDEKKLRRMTIPDPLSLQVPAAGPAMTPAIEEEDPVELAAALASPTKQARPKEAEPMQEQTQVPEPPASKPLSFAPMDVESFGLPALTEILRVLVSLLDPRNTQNTDAMRLLAMTILTSLFETSGAAIVQFPTLRAILQDSACRHLLQLARSENSSVTTYALRALNTLFEVAGQHLKLQFEFFLKFLLDKLAPNFAISLEPWNDQATNARAVDNAANGTPTAPTPPPPPPLPKTSDRAPATGESRELLLETLCNLLDLMDRHGDANITLWANYDADTECDNLFERLISFWSRAIFAQPPGEQGQDSLQIMALDALLKLVSRLAGRQDPTYQSVAWPTGLPDAKQLEHQKSRKAAILAGAARFNAKPKDGLAYMEREGLIEAKTYGREAAIARFLKECPGLDKKLLGEFIAQPNNAKILEEFIALFDFTDKNVADAMREMLESFRLPGEAHPIAQITETFAKAYAGTGSKEVADQDAVYVLAYSVIMLNTDLHNPQNKKRRMTAEDYRRNLRGVNGGKDFDIEYLNNIYESIRRREIIMPEEHMGALGFDYSWKELLRRSRTAGQLIACDTNIFDTSVFARSWRPIVAALAHAFSTYQDEHLLERSIAGFRQCAALASTFGMVELFDFMVKTLAGATGLLEDSIATGPINNAQVEAEGQKLTVGPLSVGFGVNFKGQMAAVVLFTIANGNGDAMRTSWPELLQILKNLFVHSLLPDEMRKMFLFGQDPEEIPLRPKRLANAPAPDPRAQGGLFSTLSSYLMAPSASPGQGPPPPDVTDEDIESTLCTIDCIASCRIDEMFAQISTLSPESLQCAVAAAKEMADKHTTERLVNARRASEAPSSGTSTPQVSVLVRGQLPYDPCAIFSQEMLAGFTCNAPACPDDAWISAVQHFSSILSEPQRFHPLLVERAVVSLLRLISMPRSGPGRDQALITLDTMRSIPAELRPALVEQIVLGLSHALSQGASVATTATEWNLIISLIADCAFARNAGAAQHAFQTVKQLAEGGLTVDNYAGVIALLRDIAGAADVIATAHRERRDSQRRTLTEKKEQAEYDEVSKKRGQEAVAALEATKAQIPRLITESGRLDGWRYFWMPLMDALAQQCVNGFRPVRQAAIGHLQKVLLAPQVLSGEHVQLALIFEEIIFPALSELLKPQVFQRDSEPGGMQETRMRMCNMLCKIFLHYLVQLNESAQELNDLWLKVLDFYDRFLNCGKRDQLAESLPETVKNILLVMQASDILVPPPPKGTEEHRSPAQQELWKITQERVSKFLPALLDEIVSRAEPAPAPAAEEPAPASAPVADE